MGVALFCVGVSLGLALVAVDVSGVGVFPYFVCLCARTHEHGCGSIV